MTEEEWRSANFDALLGWFGCQPLDRKVSLCCAAVCRLFWDRLDADERVVVDDGDANLEYSSQALEVDQLMWTLIRESTSGERISRGDGAALLRDVFGNPFRPVVFDPKWRTEDTTGIALKMYDEREFAAMPILADALEEAGCDSQDILTHCREPGVHVRGCWVVDLVLGTE